VQKLIIGIGRNLFQICLLAMLVFVSARSDAHADGWVFAGVTQSFSKGTINKYPEKYGYAWIKSDGSYPALKKQFREALKSQYKDLDFRFKNLENQNFFAAYRIEYMASQWKGSTKKRVTYYKFYFGKTREKILSQLESDRRRHSYVATTLVEDVDLNAKQYELDSLGQNPVMGRPLQ